MNKLKNKKTFLIFLLGFYAVIAVFTGVVMYLPYLATEEYYEEDAETYENEESYEDEESSGDEDTYDEEPSEDEDTYDEEASEDEDTYNEEASEDEDTYDEEASEDEDTYDEEASEDEDTYDEEASENEDTYDEEASENEDTYDEEASEDEDTYDEEASEDENTYKNEDIDEDTEDTSVPHTEDTEDGSHDDSVVVPTPISETTVNNIRFSYTGKGKLNIRKEPSKSGNIVGTISTNTKGMILEFVNDEWAKVTYNNKEGYVAYEYIEYTLPEDAVIPSPKPSAMP